MTYYFSFSLFFCHVGESLLTSLFTLFLISIRLTHKSLGRIYKLNQKLKEQINLSCLCNFQLFASDIEGNISLRKFRNGWVAKKLMSLTFFVKFRVFEREFLRNHSVHRAQIFRENYSEVLFY